MKSFLMNGRIWRVRFVKSNSLYLIDRSGERRVATTDPDTSCVYLSEDLSGEFLNRVLIHELGHVVMISYNLLPYIHRVTLPEYWVEVEEWICNLIADYGYEIFSVAQRILGDNAWKVLPYQMGRLISA